MIKYSKGFKAKDVWLNRAWKKLYQHAGKYQTGHSASGIKWEGRSGNQHTIASCGTSELFISVCNGSPWMGAKQHRKPPGFFVVVFFSSSSTTENELSLKYPMYVLTVSGLQNSWGSWIPRWQWWEGGKDLCRGVDALLPWDIQHSPLPAVLLSTSSSHNPHITLE